MDYPDPPVLISQLAAETNVLNNTLSLFDLSSSSFPFTSKRMKKILERRKQLEGQLFVDLMLEQAGIVSPERLFPPKDSKAFKMLVEEILTSEWGVGISQTTEYIQQASPTAQGLTAGIKRACLIYYLLAWWGDGRHLTYSDEQRISGQFAELTHAHFLMDIGNAAEATSLLCTPLIRPTSNFSKKMFHALSVATDANPSILMVRYARMAKPRLDPDTGVLSLYISALARVNFVEAWHVQRMEEGELRNTLLTNLFEAILTPRPLKNPLHLLSSLPLQPFEQSFLTKYTVKPPLDIPEPSLAALQSLMILRLTHEGEYATAVKLNREYTQYAEELLNSEGKSKSADSSKSHSLKGKKDKENEKLHVVPHAYESLEKFRPGVLLAQKQEEWRETLKESVALLPLEHRRVLEAQLHEGSMALTSFNSGAPPAANTSLTGDPSANAGLSMEMSWEAVDGSSVLQSTPPRTTSAANKAVSPMPPPVTPGQNTRQPSSSPHPAFPSSPVKKTPRNSLSKSTGSTIAPVATNTLGKMMKPPTPKRTGMSYLTPLRTPITPSTSHNDGIDSLANRSMAPPPSTGRIVNKNAFFDPAIRAIQGLILDGKTPKGDKEGDVEMRDGDETEDADDDIIGDTEGEGDSFVIAPREANAFNSASSPYPNISGLAALGGGLISAASIVQIKKAQEREREREQQEAERAERERVERERKQAELVERRARLEAVRRSLGGGADSSFGSMSGADVSAGAGGKRKRDRADIMTREDEELLNASDNDVDDAGMLTGRGKRKSDNGVATLVRKPLAGSVGAGVPMSTRSITSAGKTSRSGALVPPTSIAPSVSVATALAHQEQQQQAGVRRSSRISNTSGSQTGSNQGPSPSPEPTEEGEETADEEDGEMSMPGAYVMDEEESTTGVTRARRSGRKPSSSSLAVNKPTSKSKAKKPTSSGTAAGGTARKTRSSKSIGVPAPIAEDTADEEDTNVGKEKPQRGRAVTRGLSSGTGFASIRVPVPESVTRQQQQRAQEALSPTEEGGPAGDRRSSRRLTALVGGGAGSGSESTGAAGGRKTRKA